ncbi:MAG TPA: hypothetical protein PKA53_03730 [Sphingobacterium sp.]|nr:hypothetical protein [Sphingobacterium sp.]
MKQTYKLTTSKLDGYIQVTYFNSYLIGLEINIKQPMSQFQFDSFIRLLPYDLDLDKFRLLGLHVEEIKEMAANKKIALFCTMYEKHVGIKYKASRQDGGKIKGIKVDEQVLTHYFSSQNWTFHGKWSVSNLVRYYNELLQEIASKGKPKHPDTWSQEYANKLAPADLSGYWKHLRGLGLKPVKDSVGNVKDWV